MICYNHKPFELCRPLQVTAPCAQGVNNSKEFLFRSGIILLCRSKFPTFEGNGPAVLQKDSKPIVTIKIIRLLSNTKCSYFHRLVVFFITLEMFS